jgi:thioredoxin reductase (NADPH)
MQKEYDVIIIGGGPAGLSAGIYAARARLSSLLFEKGAIGGQIINAMLVENYPGYTDGVSGIDLTAAMHRQAEKFGVETLIGEVTGLRLDSEKKIISTEPGEYAARAVIVAGGSERQRLGVPGEAEFTGRGVSYCATCDGAFFRDKAVAVVGGGNAAITEALELTHFASEVTIIHRRNELRATKILQEKAFAEPKIEILWDSVIEAILGNNFVDGVSVNNVKTGKKHVLPVDERARHLRRRRYTQRLHPPGHQRGRGWRHCRRQCRQVPKRVSLDGAPGRIFPGQRL